MSFLTPMTRPAVVGWLVALVSLQGAAAVPMGDDSCPCLRDDQTGSVQATVDVSFGIGCAPHYLNLQGLPTMPPKFRQCNGTAKDKEWCRSSWCFVSPDNCSLPNAFLTEPPLFYSYSTCGYLDTFTPEIASTELANQTLKVAYMTNSGGYLGSDCSSGSCKGPAFEFWSMLLQQARADLDVKYQFTATNWPDTNIPFPAPVMRQFRADNNVSKSTFDACVYAAGLGFVDVCVGATSVTPARVKVSPIVPFYQNDIWLVSRQRVQKDSFQRKMARSWQPFSPDARLVIVFLVVSAGVLMVFHERCGRKAGPFKSAKRVLRGSKAVVCRRVGGSLAHGIYDGWMAFWSGGRTSFDPPKSLGGRLTAMGLALFVLMTTAAYTANLASFLVLQAQATTDISSIKDVMAGGLTVCVESALRDTLIMKTGIPQSNAVAIPVRTAVLAGVDDKLCDVAVMRLEDMLVENGQGKRCDFIPVELLFTTMQGAPVSPRAARSLTWFQQRLAAEGVWDTLVAKNTPKSNCPKTVDGENKELDLASLTGPIFACLVFFLAGLTAKVFEFILRWWSADKKWAHDLSKNAKKQNGKWWVARDSDSSSDEEEEDAEPDSVTEIKGKASPEPAPASNPGDLKALLESHGAQLAAIEAGLRELRSRQAPEASQGGDMHKILPHSQL